MVFFMIFGVFSTESHAMKLEHIFRIECAPELGTLKIKNDMLGSNLDMGQLKINPEVLVQKYGIYAHSGNIIDRDTDTPKIFETSCRLPVEDKATTENYETFFIKLEGILPSPEASSQCSILSQWSNFKLTISTDKGIIIDQIPFDEDCDSKIRINDFKFEAHTNVISYTRDKDDILLFLEEDGEKLPLPLDQEFFYTFPAPPTAEDLQQRWDALGNEDE